MSPLRREGSLKESFIEKIQARVREFLDHYPTRRPLDSANIVELLRKASTEEENNLRTIDREKVGPGAYDATQKNLWELRVALDDLLKRVTAGV